LPCHGGGSGIAGRTAATGDWHTVDVMDPEPEMADPYFDLDPAGAAMITCPVRLPGAFEEHEYPGGVVAVLQMVLSHQSPKLMPMQDDYDGISAVFATLWLLHLLTPRLLTLLATAGEQQLIPVAPGFVTPMPQQRRTSAVSFALSPQQAPRLAATNRFASSKFALQPQVRSCVHILPPGRVRCCVKLRDFSPNPPPTTHLV
jgi:hypothetical protein